MLPLLTISTLIYCVAAQVTPTPTPFLTNVDQPNIAAWTSDFSRFPASSFVGPLSTTILVSRAGKTLLVSIPVEAPGRYFLSEHLPAPAAVTTTATLKVLVDGQTTTIFPHNQRLTAPGFVDIGTFDVLGTTLSVRIDVTSSPTIVDTYQLLPLNFNPRVSISASVPTQTVLTTQNPSFTVTFTLSEPLSGFTSNSVTLQGASITNFIALSDTVFQATVTADQDSTTDCSVRVPAGSVFDSDPTNPLGNLNSTGNLEFRVDTTRPTFTIADTGSIEATAAIPVLLLGSEPIFGFEPSDITVTGGNVLPFLANDGGSVFAMVILVTAGNTVGITVTIAEGKFTDAHGNLNLALEFSVSFLPSSSQSPSISASFTRSASMTATISASGTESLSATSSVTLSETTTATSSPSSSTTAAASISASPSENASPAPTPSHTSSETPTKSITATSSTTIGASPSASSSAAPTVSQSQSPTPSNSRDPSQTSSSTVSPSSSPSPASFSSSPTPSPSALPLTYVSTPNECSFGFPDTCPELLNLQTSSIVVYVSVSLPLQDFDEGDIAVSPRTGFTFETVSDQLFLIHLSPTTTANETVLRIPSNCCSSGCSVGDNLCPRDNLGRFLSLAEFTISVDLIPPTPVVSSTIGMCHGAPVLNIASPVGAIALEFESGISTQLTPGFDVSQPTQLLISNTIRSGSSISAEVTAVHGVESTVFVLLPVGAVVDGASNPSNAISEQLTLDTVPPTAEIHLNFDLEYGVFTRFHVQNLVVTIQTSEPVVPFTASVLSISGATLGEIRADAEVPNAYGVDLTLPQDSIGEVTVSLPASRLEDTKCNSNQQDSNEVAVSFDLSSVGVLATLQLSGVNEGQLTPTAFRNAISKAVSITSAFISVVSFSSPTKSTNISVQFVVLTDRKNKVASDLAESAKKGSLVEFLRLEGVSAQSISLQAAQDETGRNLVSQSKHDRSSVIVFPLLGGVGLLMIIGAGIATMFAKRKAPNRHKVPQAESGGLADLEEPHFAEHFAGLAGGRTRLSRDMAIE